MKKNVLIMKINADLMVSVWKLILMEEQEEVTDPWDIVRVAIIKVT